MRLMAEEIDSYRRQVDKVVSSPEFSGSRQIRDFFLFASEAALSGQEHLEQEKIAMGVLHRGSDFNPVDDASVRRIASLTRQRLEKYYSGTGAHDSVLVTLPLRSYVPQFRVRDRDRPEPGARPLPPPLHRRWILAAVFAMLLSGIFVTRAWISGNSPR